MGYKTKDLVKEIKAGEIAIINHQNIDEVAAESLISAKVKAVINLQDTMTGDFPNRGPSLLLINKIPIIDKVNADLADRIENGDKVKIKKNKILDKCNVLLAKGRIFNWKVHDKLSVKSNKNMHKNFKDFVENTLNYAFKEKEEFLKELNLLDVKTSLKGKECFIICRGNNHKKDLNAVKGYIKTNKPVIIGVDGGADALIKHNIKPDIVLGDMDSISEKALNKTEEILLHAYDDGSAPGEKRLKLLGLDYFKIPSPGTSEDLALLASHQLGAKKIFALGTHTNIIDFYEKGRKGMASTLLTRMKMGDSLIDTKGISKLYQQKVAPGNLMIILAVVIMPIIILAYNIQQFQALIQLFILRLVFGY